MRLTSRTGEANGGVSLGRLCQLGPGVRSKFVSNMVPRICKPECSIVLFLITKGQSVTLISREKAVADAVYRPQRLKSASDGSTASYRPTHLDLWETDILSRTPNLCIR